MNEFISFFSRFALSLHIMKQNKSVSVVMCTYNGASRHLREQLDSIFSQTVLPLEVVVQDDCSTDDTMAVLDEYARKAPEGVAFRIYANAVQKGINHNFLSAMRLAQGELIAVSDQDDIWLPTKIEEQSGAMHDGLMMCVCRSEPFSESGAPVRYDSRCPNCNLVRLFYASMMGHCQMLRRSLLDYIPTEAECPDIYRRTCYDVMTATAAAALDSIVLIDRVLVRQRRYEEAATYVRYDSRRVRHADNALYMTWEGIKGWRRAKPWMNAHFAARREFLEWVWRKSMERDACLRAKGMPADGIATADNRIFADGIRLLDAECSRGAGALMRLWKYYIKYRHVLFYTREKDPVALVRALMHPFMQVYNYSYFVGKQY